MQVGELLQRYRKSRQFSQLSLAAESKISARHLSFIETGRSKPSYKVLITLAESLDLEHRDINLLVKSGGFTPRFTSKDLSESDMAPVKQALNLMLEKQNPYPAYVIDKDWDFVMVNATYEKLQRFILDQTGSSTLPTNLLTWLLSPEGLRPFIKNWDQLICYLLRLRSREETLSPGTLRSLIDNLSDFPDIPNWKDIDTAVDDQPMICIQLEILGVSLNLFSAVSTFGTAADTQMQDLRIETYFPADVKTRDFFELFN